MAGNPYVNPRGIYGPMPGLMPPGSITARYAGWRGFRAAFGPTAEDDRIDSIPDSPDASADDPGAGTVVIDAQTGQATVVPQELAPDGTPIAVAPRRSGIPKWAWVIGGALVLNGLVRR